MQEQVSELFIEGLTAIVTQFLCEKNLLFKYIDYLNKYKHKGIESNTVEAVIKYATDKGSAGKATCINFFNWSFNWGLTPEGAEYWGAVDTEFFSYILKTEFYKNNFD